MTMPASNINLITDVRNGFMQDSSGNASLNSQKYRDGAGKGTGNVALMDFANRAWAQGRDSYREADRPSSGCKPYSRAEATDNATVHTGFTITNRNGLPGWRTNTKGGQSYPIASYNNSYFYCLRPNVQHTLAVSYASTKWVNTATYVSHEIYVAGWQDGYKSGASTVYHNWTGLGTSGSKTFTFTPASTRRYIQISTRAFCAGTSGTNAWQQEIDCESYNMRCYV